MTSARPPSAQPDAQIDPQKSLDYWSSVPPTASGMLGGFVSVSATDLVGSRTFLAKLRHAPPPAPARVADCGAGIGRVTAGLLVKLNAGEVVVDLVEPVAKFLKTAGETLAPEIAAGRVGRLFEVGIENWVPEEGVYWVIWNQWCLGHLKDQPLVDYLVRCRRGIISQGVIVVKENNAPEGGEGDVYDELDSSVIRTDKKFRSIFKMAGLKVVRTEVQRGLPKGLYQVRSYALKPV